MTAPDQLPAFDAKCCLYAGGARPGVELNPHYACTYVHAHLYPPLLGSVTVKKIMVGYRLLAEAQRDLAAEQVAKQLREVSASHFLKEITRPVNNQRAGVELTSDETALSPLAFNAITSK